MPANKNALIRYEIIDDMLRDGRSYSKAMLLHNINRRLREQGKEISASQLRYDLYNLEVEFGAPVEMFKVSRRFLYRYEYAFSIRHVRTTDSMQREIISLKARIKELEAELALALTELRH